MKLIIGLGNPGNKYQHNRHNVGHQFIEWTMRNGQFTKEIKFIKTDCFMNGSGPWVAEKLHFFKVNPQSLFVVHDDLDIPLGQFKIQFGVGPKVHNGVNSIEETLGTKEFWRVRIGVDNRNPEARTPGEDYVLQDFTQDERKILDTLFPLIYANIKISTD